MVSPGESTSFQKKQCSHLRLQRSVTKAMMNSGIVPRRINDLPNMRRMAESSAAFICHSGNTAAGEQSTTNRRRASVVDTPLWRRLVTVASHERPEQRQRTVRARIQPLGR
jgi:hypothetical protein